MKCLYPSFPLSASAFESSIRSQSGAGRWAISDSEFFAQLFEIRLQGSEFLIDSAGFIRIQAGGGDKVKGGIVGFARIYAITVNFGAAFGPKRYTRKRQARIQLDTHKVKPALMVIILAPGKISHVLRITLDPKAAFVNRKHHLAVFLAN